MIEYKDDCVLVFGHPYMIAGVPNENADDTVMYYPDKKIFSVGVWGYQIGKDPAEYYTLEMTPNEFEKFFKENYIE